MQIIQGTYFVNHSFSGFENYIFVVISTECTVLVRSGYSLRKTKLTVSLGI